MIAKLAVWGRTRDEAIERLRRALDEYEVSGITTNLPFFREVAEDEEFVSGHLDTGFITRFNERRAAAGSKEVSQVESDLAVIAAALSYALRQRQTSVAAPAARSRWKMAGRHAGLKGLTSSKWRKP
jgi:acetyl/propionyl-CoA carboxylase alpha subunit